MAQLLPPRSDRDWFQENKAFKRVRCCRSRAGLLYVADAATCDETVGSVFAELDQAACINPTRRRIACEVVVLMTINSRRLAVIVPRQRVCDPVRFGEASTRPKPYVAPV